jgi:hypothetical protein
MDARNPYAPSRASLDSRSPSREGNRSGDTVWRDGNVLVLIRDAQLPDRCVKCNEPADEPTKARKVYWHHPAIYLLVLINALIYAVVGLIVRKKAVVAAGLCAVHKKRRRLALTLGWISLFAGVGLLSWMAAGPGPKGALLALIGFVVMLASFVIGMRLARVVYAQKIDKEFVRLKGCAPEFLDTLPQFPG